MKVEELTGAQLDYWVARAEGFRLSPNGDYWDAPADWRQIGHTDDDSLRFYSFDVTKWKPSTGSGHGGPIIERERIGFMPVLHDGETYWMAAHPSFGSGFPGPTPLVAAMRAYVASRFGDEVPDEVPQ